MSSFLGPIPRYSARRAIGLGAHCLSCAAVRDELEHEAALCDVHLDQLVGDSEYADLERGEAMWERETER